MNLAAELRHIPRSHLAGDPLPRLVCIHVPGAQYGGFYVHPFDGEYVLPNDTAVPAASGVLVVNACDGCEATVTHELRHHWQALRGLLPDAGSSFRFDGSDRGYWCAIRRYFRTYWHELDALRYERKHCPTRLNEQWLDVTLRSAA